MNLELQIVDETLSNKEFKELIQEIESLQISKISVLPCHISFLKKNLKSSCKISSLIDFPFGVMSTNERALVVNNSIKNGASSIDILCPSYMVVNRSYTYLKKDIEKIYELCVSKKVDLSYILEYRSFTYDSLYKLSKILLASGIKNIYISTGYKIDDIYDHLIAMAMIQKNVPEMHIIPNCNIFNTRHKNMLEMAEIDHIRVNSINSAKLFK